MENANQTSSFIGGGDSVSSAPLPRRRSSATSDQDHFEENNDTVSTSPLSSHRHSRRISAPLPFVQAHPPAAQVLATLKSSSNQDLTGKSQQSANNQTSPAPGSLFTTPMGSRMLSLRRFDSTTGERADDAFSMPSGNWRLIKETEFCIEWINNALHPESDPDLVHLLADGGTSGQPLQVEPAEITGPILFKACRDGWLLAKMLNYVEPDLVELKQLRRQSQLMFHHLENCELVIKGARQLGLQIVNFNAENVAKGQANVCLSLIVQIIKVAAWQTENIVNTLVGNITAGNKIPSLESLLIGWINSKLESASVHYRINNIQVDLKDPDRIADILALLAPANTDQKMHQTISESLERVKKSTVVRQKFKSLSELASALGFRWFLAEEDLLEGRRERLVAYLIHLFSKSSLAINPVRKLMPLVADDDHSTTTSLHGSPALSTISQVKSQRAVVEVKPAFNISHIAFSTPAVAIYTPVLSTSTSYSSNSPQMTRGEGGTSDDPRVQRIRKRLEDLEQQNRALLKTNEDLRKAYETQESRLKEESLHKQNLLTKELDTMRLSASKIIEGRDSLNNRVRELEHEIETQKSYFQKRQDELKRQSDDSRRRELDLRESTLKKEFEMREGQLRSSFEERERQLKREADEQKRRLESELDRVSLMTRAELSRRDSLIQQEKQERDAVTKKEQETREQLSARYENESKQMNAKIASLEASISQLSTEKEYFIAHEREYLQQIESLRLEFTAGQQQFDQLNEKKAQLIQEKFDLQQACDKYETDLAESRMEITRQEQIIGSLDAEIDRTERELQKALGDKNAAESDLKSLRELHDKIAADYLLCNNLLDNERDRTKILEDDNLALASKLHDAEKLTLNLNDELDKKKAIVNGLTSDLQARISELTTVQSYSREDKGRLASTEAQLKAVERELVSIKEQLFSSRSECNRLGNELLLAKSTSNNVGSQNEQLAAELAAAKQSLAQITEEIGSLKYDKKQLQADLLQSKQFGEGQAAELKLALDNIASLKQQFDNSISVKTVLEKSLLEKSDEIFNSSTMLQSKQLELNNVSAELDSARTRLNDALAELNAKSSQIGHMEAANAETQHEIQRLKDHISKSTGLNSQLNSALHAAAKLEEQVKEKDLQLLQLQESKGEMEQEVQRINGELISLRAQTETASMSNADQENLSNEKQSQIVQLLQSCAEAKTEIKELNDQISELNEALIARDSAINSLEASVNEKKRQIEQFESEFGSKDQEAQCLARDLTNAQAQCRIAEAAKASLGAAMEEKESRIREYENALRTKNGEIAEIEKLLQKVTNDINNSEVKRTTAERRLDLKTRECHHKTQEIRKLLEDKQQLEQELMDAVLDKESFEKIIQESARRIELAIQTSMTDDMKKLADTGATKSESELYSESHTRPVSALNMQLRRLLRLFNHAQEQSAEQKYDNERLSREIYELNARKLEPLKQQNSALLAKEREWREQLIPSFERSIAQLESDLRKKQDIITRLQSTEQHLTEEVETMRLATEEKSQLAAVDLPAMKERVEWLEGQLCAKQAEVQRWKDANSILRDKIKGVTASSDRDASRILSEKAAMISYSTKQFKEVMLQRSSTQRSSADRPVPPAMDLTMVGERRISNPTSADPAPVDSVASTVRDTHNANHMSSQL